jgi:thiamine-phosphate pyrophosphorylase
MTSFHQRRLYTFVDTAYLQGRPAAEIARQLCDGGADVLQIRAKNEPKEAVRRLIDAIQPITQAAQVALVINDYPDLAHEAGAEAVHLGQEDFFEAGFAHARDITGSPPGFSLGLSTHAPEQAERAIAAQPDYIAIGPIFATPTKPGRPGVTLDYVRWAARNVTIPWYAIGGIHPGNLDAILEAGATRICIVSALLNAPDITKACQDLRNRLASAR